MKQATSRIISICMLAVLALASCAPKIDEEIQVSQPHLISGTYQVTNDFVLTKYYVENAVALVDMHAFVLRDEEWELPVESQVLGVMNFDPESLSGTFDLNLPAVPRGTLNDVDNNGVEDLGVQIFSVAYSPNLYGGPFSQGDDRSRGWPSYLASVKTDTENNDEVTGGRLLIWAPDAEQNFPSWFGTDGLLFTADDPAASVPAGYSVVDLDQNPFVFSQEATPEFTLFEPSDIAIKDFSDKSYTEAFDQMFEIVRKEYAFADIKDKAPDWDALYVKIHPLVEQAEKDADPNAFYLAMRDFTWAFRDGHVGLGAAQYSQQDFQTRVSGGYGFAIREFDDGHVFATFVMEGGPAQLAGMQIGAEILEFNELPITQAIDTAQSYSLQSSDFAIRYQKARYLLTALPGDQAIVRYINPGKASSEAVTLTAVAEQQSFGRTSVYFGVDRSSLLPVDAKIIPAGNDSVGYIRMNSNADDLNLTIRLFERALQNFTAAEVAGIVIDMRYNNGGASLGLAGFLTDQEIQMGQLAYYSDASGKFEPEGLREKVLPNEHQYHFDKMVLLVGQACFSACEIEAYGFSQVPGMIVAGQMPTAGVEAETARGQFILPEGFELTIPTGRMTLPDGSIFLEGQGVQPTLRVPVDATTAYATGDIVLQAGIDAVLRPLGTGIIPSGAPTIATISEAQDALAARVPFLEDIARESYEPAAFSQPGTITYSVALGDAESVIWGYAWGASDADMLQANFDNIKLKFMLDGREVSEDMFNVTEVEANGKIYRFIYTSLSDWPAGEHHLSTTATFTTTINDGQQDYLAGDYVLDYTVYVQP
jgi:C-terminal processing protease CtpA/Prc